MHHQNSPNNSNSPLTFFNSHVYLRKRLKGNDKHCGCQRCGTDGDRHIQEETGTDRSTKEEYKSWKSDRTYEQSRERKRQN